MVHTTRALVLFLLTLAVGCGDSRKLESEEVGTASSKLTTLSDLTYPMSSMTSWPDANYGACGSSYFTGKCHTGADIAASYGTPVYAITAGTVVVKSATQDVSSNCRSSGWGYDYGVSNTCNMGLLVQHYDSSGQPFVSVYGHLRYDPNLTVGTTYTAGQQIGVIGRWYNTWNQPKSGDHLHWGIFPGAKADMPLSGFGMMPCSASQPPQSTFPAGCSNNGFVTPGTFITEHFPAATPTPYSHSDPPTICGNQPTPDGSWYYSCYEQSLFEEGEPVWVLLRLYDVTVSHQFRVKTYKDDVHQWDWTTDMINVSGTWQYSHFWPALYNSTPGKWRFDLFVVPQGESEIYVDNITVRVFPWGTLYAQGGGGLMFDYPGVNYSYDGNAYTCAAPIEGGQSTNWVYTCGLPRATFEQGERVNALVRLDDIHANFRISTDVYKDGVYQWNSSTGWNDVGQWGWSWYYYPMIMETSQTGNWEFRVSVDEGYGYQLLDTLYFTVTPNSVPFQYGGLVTCKGPVTGGAETSWVYTCQNDTDTFNINDPAIGLVRIDNVTSDFRWQVVIYANGVYQWTYTTDWNDVGEWGWDKAFFWQNTGSVWLSGSWEYKFYIDTGSGFQYVDSAYFTVN